VGVIVPYRYLIGLIRQELKHYGNSLLQQVCIDTVERYQGSQRDVIIYAFGISQPYQLDFLTANTFMEDGHPIDRKLNVAMTRARRQLIMTGRTDLLRESSLFREIISQYGTDSTKNT
jgi:superfamily I DNA and/or RNA helicase